MQLGAPTFHASDELNSSILLDDVIDVLSLHFKTE